MYSILVADDEKIGRKGVHFLLSSEFENVLNIFNYEHHINEL